MLGLPHGTNYLVDYDPAWPAEFAAEVARIRAALAHLTIWIEHYGSTAVPSLRAKPVLDILLGVQPLEKWLDCRKPLENLGYDYAAGAGVPGNFIFGRGQDRSERTHLVHIVEYGGVSWQQSLRFRDALRTSATLRAEYVALKEQAAKQAPTGRAQYNTIKSPWIERTLAELSA